MKSWAVIWHAICPICRVRGPIVVTDLRPDVNDTSCECTACRAVWLASDLVATEDA